MADIELTGKHDLVRGHDFQEGDTIRINGAAIGTLVARQPDGISADGKSATVTINLSKGWRP